MRVLILLVALSIPHIIFAQSEQKMIKGKVLAYGTNKPLANSHIKLYQDQKGYTTDEKGEFEISTIAGISTLIFSHVGYSSVVIKERAGKNRELIVKLKQKTYQLPEVLVSQSPVVVFGSKEFKIHDYEFFNDNIMLIVYEKRLNESSIFLLDHNEEITQTHPVPGKPEKLIQDCLGNPHLITKEYSFQVSLQDTGLVLYLNDPVEFSRAIEPCMAKSGKHLYYKQYANYLKTDAMAARSNRYDDHRKPYAKLGLVYFHIHGDVKLWEPFAQVFDDKRIKMLKGESDYQRRAKLDTNMPAIPARVIAFNNRILFDPPVYSPLKIVDDTIYVFNHLNDRIDIYSLDTKKLGEVEISYHHEETYRQNIVVDDVLGKVYSVGEENGITVIDEINLQDGTTDRILQLPGYRYIEKVKIKNGRLYFLYRPFESFQNKYLYSKSI